VIAERIAGQFEGPWLQGYARGKLRNDPVFKAAFELLKNSSRPVLDVGCGIGLFEFYLRERGFVAPLVGIDFDARKIARATAARGETHHDVTFSVGDVFATDPFHGDVVLFDVLHYLPAEQQRALLERLADHVAPGGLCLIRATPRDASWRFRLTQLQEHVLRAVLWMKSRARHYGSIEDIVAPFRARGFACEVRPLWGRTPFNSHLFVFRASE